MLYDLEQGAVEKQIIQNALKSGNPLPQRIQNAPQLFWGLQLYFHAFFDLATCRPLGFTEGSIRWLDVEEYCIKLNLTDEQKEDMHYYIRNMDNAYLNWRDKKRNG